MTYILVSTVGTLQNVDENREIAFEDENEGEFYDLEISIPTERLIFSRALYPKE